MADDDTRPRGLSRPLLAPDPIAASDASFDSSQTPHSPQAELAPLSPRGHYVRTIRRGSSRLNDDGGPGSEQLGLRKRVAGGSRKDEEEAVADESKDPATYAAVLLNDAIHSRNARHKLDAFGMRIHKILRASWYQLAVLVVLLGVLMLAAVEQPSTMGFADQPVKAMWPAYATVPLELALLALLLVDVLMRYLWLGHERFMESRWVLVKGGVAVFAAVNAMVSWGVPAVPRLHRLLRPLLFIAHFRNVAKIFLSMLETVPKVANVTLLLVIHILLCGALAHVLFRGIEMTREDKHRASAGDFDVSYQCNDTAHSDIYGSPSPAEFRYCNPFAKQCFDYFGSYLYGLHNLFVLLTTANYPDVMLPAYHCSSWAPVFFVFFLTVGLYFVMNLILAVVVSVYKERTTQRATSAATRRVEAVDLAFRFMVDAADDGGGWSGGGGKGGVHGEGERGGEFGKGGLGGAGGSGNRGYHGKGGGSGNPLMGGGIWGQGGYGSNSQSPGPRGVGHDSGMLGAGGRQVSIQLEPGEDDAESVVSHRDVMGEHSEGTIGSPPVSPSLRMGAALAPRGVAQAMRQGLIDRAASGQLVLGGRHRGGMGAGAGQTNRGVGGASGAGLDGGDDDEDDDDDDEDEDEGGKGGETSDEHGSEEEDAGSGSDTGDEGEGEGEDRDVARPLQDFPAGSKSAGAGAGAGRPTPLQVRMESFPRVGAGATESSGSGSSPGFPGNNGRSSLAEAVHQPVEVLLDRGRRQPRRLHLSTWERMMKSLRPDLTRDQREVLFTAMDRRRRGFLTKRDFRSVVDYLEVNFERKWQGNSTDYFLAKSHPEWFMNVRLWLRRIVVNWKFVLLVDLLIYANCLLVIIQLAAENYTTNDQGQTERHENKGLLRLDTAITVILVLFVIELTVKLLGLGFGRFCDDGFNVFDGIVIPITAIAEVVVPSMNVSRSGRQLAQALPILRLVRLIRSLRALKGFGTIIRTIGKIVVPFSRYIVVVLLVYYTFSILGMELFAGVTAGDAVPQWTSYRLSLYQLDMTFDSLGRAMVVLWALMIVNNWAVTEEGIVIAFHKGTQGTRWSMLYFYLWYFVIVIVVSNIVTAFLLEDFEVTQAQIIEIENNYEPEWRRRILEAARDLRVKERTTWNVTRKEHPYHAYERMFADEIREHIRMHDQERASARAGGAVRAPGPVRDQRYFVDSDDEAFTGPRLRQRPRWARRIARAALAALGEPRDPRGSDSAADPEVPAGPQGAALAVCGVVCPEVGSRAKGLRRAGGGAGAGADGGASQGGDGSDSESSDGGGNPSARRIARREANEARHLRLQDVAKESAARHARPTMAAMALGVLCRRAVQRQRLRRRRGSVFRGSLPRLSQEAKAADSEDGGSASAGYGRGSRNRGATAAAEVRSAKDGWRAVLRASLRLEQRARQKKTSARRGSGVGGGQSSRRWGSGAAMGVPGQRSGLHSGLPPRSKLGPGARMGRERQQPGQHVRPLLGQEDRQDSGLSIASGSVGGSGSPVRAGAGSEAAGPSGGVGTLGNRRRGLARMQRTVAQPGAGLDGFDE